MEASSHPPTRIQCPDCEKTFTPSGMGPHRRIVHGYRVKIGRPKGSKKAISPQLAGRFKLHGTFPCTVENCGFVAKWSGGLKKHMSAKHPTLEALPVQLKQIDGLWTCPECKNTYGSKTGLGIHRKAMHGVEGKAHVKHHLNGGAIEHIPSTITRATAAANDEEGQAAPNGFETICAIALGRFQGLCREMAAEYDVPPVMLTRGLLELIHATQVRSKYRGALHVSAM